MNFTHLLTFLAWACSLAMTAYTAYFFVIALFSLKKPKEYPHAALPGFLTGMENAMSFAFVPPNPLCRSGGRPQ